VPSAAVLHTLRLEADAVRDRLDRGAPLLR